MSRNLVVCCDGTGNEFGVDNSNVAKFCQILRQDATQHVYYHPGIGTMGAPNAGGRLARAWSRVAGLAFGSGLLDLAGDAYRFLMQSYEDGDRIFLFGFSRGAYTVRALAGMIHMFGLLYPGNQGQIPYVTRMFARRCRRHGRFQSSLAVDAEFKAAFGRDVGIYFCGVWDTVSSVGWIYDPVKLPYTANNPSILHGRHAVSIDERRCFFCENLWGRALRGQDLLQVWFAGVHSDIGGSYAEAESGLSKITLAWMARHAESSGLRVDPVRREAMFGTTATVPPHARPDPAARLHKSLTGVWWLLEFLPHRYYDHARNSVRLRIPLGARRVIPEGSVLHPAVLERIALLAAYRPPLPQVYCVEGQAGVVPNGPAPGEAA